MNIEALKTAKIELQNRPLVAIDISLNLISNLEKSDGGESLPSVLTLFCKAVLRSEGLQESIEKSETSFEVLFNHDFNRQVQRFIAISLVRLLSCSSDCFDLASFRIEAFALFDRVFSDDLYKVLKIDKKEQTFIKQNKLEGIVAEIEEDIFTFIESIEDLSRLQYIRQTFMQKIHSPLNSAVVVPFLPRQLLEARLDNIFTVVDEYLKEESPKSVQLFEVAKDNLQKYANEANEFGTKYSKKILAGLAEKLRVLITSHFNGNPMSKPAHLNAEKMEKKYPLHVVGTIINISFIIQNPGPGYAFNTCVTITTSNNLITDTDERYLGHMEPGYMNIDIPAKVSRRKKNAEVLIGLVWSNYDGSKGNYETVLDLESQKTNVDWEYLKGLDPYSLEPITDEKELVGRNEVLSRLLSKIKNRNIGSSYIHGQKRVGKTSIVRTLESRLMNVPTTDINVIYLEGGDYIHPEPGKTVENLGKIISEEVQRSDMRISHLELPVFNNALAPLGEYLRLVQTIIPDYRLLIILDEFDELPSELYKTGITGDSFFLTIRSISGKPSFGFILVGGEKIPHIISSQGDKLNKFDAIRVDYFDKKEYWTDFQSLVRKPVDTWFEISDDALVALYEETSGHPYFTKLICRALFYIMVQRRDSHVTRKEVEEATKIALRQAATNSFKHLWDDDIVGEYRELKSIERQKTLLAFSEATRTYGNVNTDVDKESIVNCARDYGITDIVVETCLRDFVNRDVLILTKGLYSSKIRFFSKWLMESGVSEIISTLPVVDPVILEKRKQEEDTIASLEIVEVATRWGSYRGRAISEDKIRAWLNQYENRREQRLMFEVLKGVTFYNRDTIRRKMKEAHGIVTRGLLHSITGRRRRRDIIVSYLDQVGKSGAQYAKLYAEENEIFQENVVERNKLSDFIRKHRSVQALVFLDDFIGTGGSANSYFEIIADECGDTLRNSKMKVYLIAICGFSNAIGKIEKKLKELNLDIQPHLCDVLDESAKCFSDESSIFTDSSDRKRAEDIASSYGIRLQKRAPLGYGDCQATIVFEDSCPNNSLPILWDKSKNWIPLFERL